VSAFITTGPGQRQADQRTGGERECGENPNPIQSLVKVVVLSGALTGYTMALHRGDEGDCRKPRRRKQGTLLGFSRPANPKGDEMQGRVERRKRGNFLPLLHLVHSGKIGKDYPKRGHGEL